MENLPGPRPSGQRWTAAVLTQLVVVLAVLVAGVTGAVVVRDRNSDNSTDVLSVVEAASTSLQSAHTFRSTFEMKLDVNGRHITATGDLLSDITARSAAGSFNAPGLGRMDVVQIGDRGYFRLPSRGVDAAGHHWLAVTVPGGSAQSAVGGQDPMAMFKLLAKPQGVTKVGKDKIHGTATTHYRVQLDPERMAALGSRFSGIAVPPGATDALKNLTMDVWIDRANRPRRMTMRLSVQGVSMNMRVDVRDYGAPVTVTAPAASDVTELPSIASLGPAIMALHNG